MNTLIRKKRDQKGYAKDKKTTLFFLLSGEHPTLPFSEVKSIFEAEGYKYRILERLIQVLRVETDVDSIQAVEFRAAMTRVCGVELFSCNAVITEIVEKLLNTPLHGFIKGGDSFAVRIQRVQGCVPHIVGMELERKLGKLILKRIKGARVNLRTPNKTFFGVLTGKKFVFGLKLIDIPPTSFVKRNSNRLFFHPTVMSAKLARCMVNLTQPKTGNLVLDPFCGTASILIEAGLIGCRVIGLDVQRQMVEGSLQNLLYYDLNPEGIVVADARQLPISKVDCVVTDPPYGRSSTTLGLSTQQIINDFLIVIENSLPKRGKICIASPKSVGLGEIGKALGFNHLESHFYYVHKSLTREIAVFERT